MDTFAWSSVPEWGSVGSPIWCQAPRSCRISFLGLSAWNPDRECASPRGSVLAVKSWMWAPHSQSWTWCSHKWWLPFLECPASWLNLTFPSWAETRELNSKWLGCSPVASQGDSWSTQALVSQNCWEGGRMVGLWSTFGLSLRSFRSAIPRYWWVLGTLRRFSRDRLRLWSRCLRARCRRCSLSWHRSPSLWPHYLPRICDRSWSPQERSRCSCHWSCWKTRMLLGASGLTCSRTWLVRLCQIYIADYSGKQWWFDCLR